MENLLDRVFIALGIILLYMTIIALAVLTIVLYTKYIKPIINKSRIRRYTLHINDIASEINSYNINDIDTSLVSVDDLRFLELDMAKTKNKLNSLLPKEEPTTITIENIEITEKVKSIIDTMISTETYSVMRRCLSTKKKYEITKLDEDVTAVSTKVFNSLNKDLFNTPMVFSNEYIMSYIVGQTFNLLLNMTTTYNENISLS